MQPNEKIFRRILIFFLLVAAILVAVVVETLRNTGRSIATSDWVNHTHATRNEAAEILSSLHAAEGALRTFVLSGDPRDQSAYREAFSELAEHVDVAKALTRADPLQTQQILQIEELLAKRASLARDIVRIRQQQSSEALQQLLKSDAGSETVRDIRRRIEKFRNEQAQLLAERDKASFLQAQTTRWSVLTGLVLDLLLLLGAGWLIRDDIRARQLAARVMHEANEQLEVKVRERTAELSAANETLRAQALEDRWAKQSLEHQLRYNQLIINSITDLVLVVTKILNISRINPAVVHHTGRDAADLVDRPLSEIVRLDSAGAPDEPAMFDPVAQALDDGQDIHGRPALLTDKLGRTHRVRFSLFPLRDRDKVVGGVVTLQLLPPA